MESQRESLRTRRGDDVEYSDKIRQKNREINAQLEEIKNLTDHSELLTVTIKDMEQKLKEAAKEMDSIAEDYVKIKKLSGQSDSKATRLKQENDVLKEQVDQADAKDDEQWQQLFDVTRAIMLMKSAQANVALEELEQLATEQGKEGVMNEQGLIDQIRELEEENKRLERMGGAGGSRDTRQLQNEVHELSRQGDLLQRELKEKERDLYKEKSEAERVSWRDLFLCRVTSPWWSTSC
eukprot:XP_011670078.1 PREDICTED: centrosomal protein of 290 kDa-like [Strongylocentrotus purpuratus]